MNPSTPVSKSKTIITNILAMASTYALPAMGVLHIDPTTQKAVIGLSAINIALRFLTKGPLRFLTDTANQ